MLQYREYTLRLIQQRFDLSFIAGDIAEKIDQFKERVSLPEPIFQPEPSLT